MGARSMQRVIDDKIKQIMAKLLLFGELKDGGEVAITKDEKLHLIPKNNVQTFRITAKELIVLLKSK